MTYLDASASVPETRKIYKMAYMMRNVRVRKTWEIDKMAYMVAKLLFRKKKNPFLKGFPAVCVGNFFP